MQFGEKYEFEHKMWICVGICKLCIVIAFVIFIMISLIRILLFNNAVKMFLFFF